MKIKRWAVIFLIMIIAFGLADKRVNAAVPSQPEELIRFHVLANSDSEEDQALKRAVRDAILEEVSPRLAESTSLDESRQILTGMRTEIEHIGQEVVQKWGKSYEVQTDYGYFTFPTKSYGSLVLPAGEYEAVRVLIGEAEGSNWWCVLFPPLCFVDIEHSTAVQVDGKAGIPIQKTNSLKQDKTPSQEKLDQGKTLDRVESQRQSQVKPVVKFWVWEMLKKLFGAA